MFLLELFFLQLEENPSCLSEEEGIVQTRMRQPRPGCRPVHLLPLSCGKQAVYYCKPPGFEKDDCFIRWRIYQMHHFLAVLLKYVPGPPVATKFLSSVTLLSCSIGLLMLTLSSLLSSWVAISHMLLRLSAWTSWASVKMGLFPRDSVPLPFSVWPFGSS